MPATPPPPPPAAAFSFAGDDNSSLSSASSPQLFQQAARHQERLERYRGSPELRRTPSPSVAPSTNFPPPSLPPHVSAAVAAMSLGPPPGPLASTYLSNNIPTPPPSAAQAPPVTFNGRSYPNLPSHLAAQLQAINQQERGSQPLPVSFSFSAKQLIVLNVTYRFLPLLLLFLALWFLLLVLDLALLLLSLSPLLPCRF